MSFENVKYVSVWNGGYEVETDAKFNFSTGEVFDIQVSPVNTDHDGDELEFLDYEKIILSNNRELRVKSNEAGGYFARCETYDVAQSIELETMLKNRIGYRNNDMGTGFYYAKDVIKFEEEELENEDTLLFCLKTYGTYLTQNIIDEKFGSDKVFGLWLTSYDGVLENYSESDAMTPITSYQIPINAIPIADLGGEGILFAFTEDPRECAVETKNHYLQ